MAGATLNNMDAILQNDYQAKTLDAINNSAFLYNKMKKKVLNWTGRAAVYAVKVSNGSSADYTNGTPPTEDHAVWKNLTVTAKILQARGRLSSELMVATDAASAKAFVSAVTEENKSCELSLIQKANRNFWSGGLCVGFLNERQAAGAGTDWEFAGDASKLAAIVAQGACTVSIIRLDTYAVVSVETVNSVDVVNSTINLTALDTSAVGAGFACGVKIATMVDAAITIAGLGLQPIGIYGQLIEPTHFGVDRTTATGDATQLQSNCRTANTAGAQARVAISKSMPQRMINTIEDFSGIKPNQIVGHSSALEKYADAVQVQFQQQLGSSGKAPTYTGGYGSIVYGDMPFDSDKDCAKGAIFFLNWDFMRLAERQPVKLWNHAGSAFRPIANSTDVEFIYEGFHNQVVELPGTCGVLAGLTF